MPVRAALAGVLDQGRAAIAAARKAGPFATRAGSRLRSRLCNRPRAALNVGPSMIAGTSCSVYRLTLSEKSLIFESVHIPLWRVRHFLGYLLKTVDWPFLERSRTEAYERLLIFRDRVGEETYIDDNRFVGR